MKRINLTLTTAVLAAWMLLLAGPAAAAEIGVKASYWIPSISGTITSDTEFWDGTDINMDDDLAWDNEGVLGGQAFLGFGKHRLSLMYSTSDIEGQAYLTRPLVFHGTTFASGEDVHSKWEFRMWDAEYQYKFMDLENLLAGGSLRLIGQLKLLDTSLTLTSPAKSEIASWGPAIIMAGLGTHIGILADILAFDAQVTGMAYSGDWFMDGRAELSVTPFPLVGLSAGYRYVKLDTEDDQTIIDVQMDGFYGFVRVAF